MDMDVSLLQKCHCARTGASYRNAEALHKHGPSGATGTEHSAAAPPSPSPPSNPTTPASKTSHPGLPLKQQPLQTILSSLTCDLTSIGPLPDLNPTIQPLEHSVINNTWSLVPLPGLAHLQITLQKPYSVLNLGASRATAASTHPGGFLPLPRLSGTSHSHHSRDL
ncbi:hypothetical protein CGCSCA4_v003414 [Colletotrichum siamense]|uniref:Uncharacterized protein n=1 Tax=Colletotrichum siamense TaxID=690259 RepID=A0A9P5K8E7_COLSI|nr:hypothetical protein CGCSCA4_v003414 [Colletotrichum siamense]KAF4863025.1 hypothetical protein CGCSCA2_v003368 [Colletotrichum siamense]